MDVDLDLVKKYNRPGPRYTSYPTVPHFRSSFGLEEWEAEIELNNRENGRDLSLYFHIPFCDTLCWFCACTVVITRDPNRIDEYLNLLSGEINLVRERLRPGRKVVQLHFGGGTPTSLSPPQIRRLCDKIKESFPFASDAELGCEMDPRGLTLEHLKALRAAGFNRVSMGVQDFDPAVQKAIHRFNPPDLVQKCVHWIRSEGFESLNLDLIYGLPHQTVSSFEKTLEIILGLDPDRLAVYNYAHVPWLKVHQKLIHEEDLPRPEEKLSLLKVIIETLTSRGYVYIGMDHFAKPTDELTLAQNKGTLQRNFQGYSTKAGADIYAMGMSSISQLERTYAQNFKELSTYTSRVVEGKLPVEKGFVLSRDDRIRREVIMRLMCDMSLDFRELSRGLEIDFTTYFEKELEHLSGFESDGLIVTSQDDGFKVTDTGRLFVRNIAMVFDAYLDPSETRYSKTV
ncbi:MAG: oxygen-independent coproporphyrinogen III oxidase [Fidelibacterota bacterium]